MDIHKITQLVEEVSLTYTNKFEITRDSDWFLFKLQEELGELTQAYLMMSQRARTKGKSTKNLHKDFQDEVADVFCHILLLAHHHNIDIEKAVEEKWLKWTTKSKNSPIK